MKIPILTLSLLAATQAQGQAQCGPRDTVVQFLADTYGETRQAAGLERSGALVEMFANMETGSWTAIASSADGTSCLLADGTGWQPDEAEPEGIDG